MKNAVLCFASITMLSACAVAKQTYMPDGRTGYTIDCSGAALTWASCYQKIGDVCGSKGYDILAQGGDQGSTMSSNQFGTYGGMVVTRNLIAACKP